MEFWIGIIFDTICLAIALFMAINPKGFARGMKYQSVRQTKIFRIVGIIAVIILVISLTSRVLTLSSLKDVAHDDFVDVFAFDASAFEGFCNDDSA